MQKKVGKLVFVLCFLFFALAARAAVSDYVFTQSEEDYVEITGGTVLMSGIPTLPNSVFEALPMGFNIIFDGNIFNTVSIAENGFLAMGNSIVTSNLPISSSTSGSNLVAALARDITSRDNGELRYQTLGNAPTRVFVAQWKNFRRFPTSAANDILNFQIRLYEGRNRIVLCYGYMEPVNITTAATIQVGLRGATNADFNNRTTTTDWTATTAGTANNNNCRLSASVFPPEGLQFIFEPENQNLPPSPAIVIYPNNYASEISPATLLQWTIPSAIVDGCYISMGTDNPPTNLVFRQNIGYNTIYNPEPDLAANTTYYWQITPYNAFGETQNPPVWNFTTLSQVPNPPQNHQPINLSTVQNLNLNLQWNSGGGYLSGYRLYLGTDNPPSNILDGINVGYNTSHPITVEYGQTYYWQVVAYNPVGDAAGCPILSFSTRPSYPEIPSIFSPENAETGVFPLPEFSFEIQDDLYLGAKINIGTDNPPTNIVYDLDLGSSTSYIPAQALPGGSVIYWQIVPYSQFAPHPNPPVWQFTTRQEFPEAANLVSPAMDASGVWLFTDLVFSGNDPITSGYKLNLGTDNPPTNIVYDLDLGNSTSYIPAQALPGSSVIYWQIVPYSPYASSPDSPVWSFETRSAQPEPIWEPNPNNPGFELIPETVELSWMYSDPFTEGFYLCLGTDNPPTNIYNMQSIPLYNGYTVSLQPSTTYYWQVFPYNELETLNDAVVYSFNTWSALPSPVWEASPYDGMSFVDPNPVLQWWDYNEYVTGYKLYYGTYPNPQNYSEPIIITDSSYQVYLDYSTDYYWQVVPFNSVGDATDCPVWHFRSRDITPNPCTYGSPADGEYSDTRYYPNLSWESIPDAQGYYISLGTNNPPDNYWYKLDVGNTTQYQIWWFMNPNDQFYWQVIPYNEYGETPEAACPIWTFYGAQTAPEGWFSGYPNGEEVDPNGVTLEFSYEDPSIQYEIYIEREFWYSYWDEELQEEIWYSYLDWELVSTNYSGWVGGLDWGWSYQWRVDFWNDYGWGNTQYYSFVTLTGPPSEAWNPRPVENAVDVPRSVILRWDHYWDSATQGFRIYFGTDEWNLQYIGDAWDTFFTYNEILDYNTTYYWQVMPYNSLGESYWAPTWTFTTRAEGDWHPGFTEVNPGLPQNQDTWGNAWGDYDNDGDLDVYTNSGLYRNDGGYFNYVSSNLPSYSGQGYWGDYDRDGDLDIFVVRWGYQPYLYRNNSGVFQLVSTDFPYYDYYQVNWVDYDLDGDLDLFFNGTYYETYLYTNDNGTFVNSNLDFPDPYAGMSTWGDYDNDGDPDLLINGRMGIAQVLRNDVDAENIRSFTNINAPLIELENASAYWVDYDNDGDLDIFMAGESWDYGPMHTVLYQNSSGEFSQVTTPFVGGDGYDVASWGDINHDGLLDLVISATDSYDWYVSENRIRLYYNQGGSFGEAQMLIANDNTGTGVELIDIDNDGSLDIVYRTMIGGFGVLSNDGWGTNAPPPAPVLTYDQQSGMLSWSQELDDTTPNSALTYDIRIGNTWEGSEIRCPDANPQNGYRRLVQGGQRQLILPELPDDQSFFASIQAIDNSYAGSIFSNTVVINPFPEIQVSSQTLEFGTKYIGLIYSEELSISNTGTGPLQITGIYTDGTESSFSIAAQEFPITIGIGESFALTISFQPSNPGDSNDILYIESNARTLPQMTINLSGSGVHPAPEVVTNVAFTVSDYDAQINWDPVTTSVIGTPLTPDLYIVLYNATEDIDDIEKYYYLDYTEDANYTHRGVARFSPRMFYRIVAFKDYREMVSARNKLDNLKSKNLSWKQLKLLLDQGVSTSRH